MSLFDATQYGPARAAKKAQTPPRCRSDVAVAGDGWNGTSSSTPGAAHYIVGPKSDRSGRNIAGAVAACGLVVVPHTYDPTETRPGCAACAARITPTAKGNRQ